jgi:hypothetical protein
MAVDGDTKERMKILFIFLLQSYKVAMGSMLVLFVPQLCGEGVCSITDNLEKDDVLHRGALVVNFISTASFATCYLIELKRENWCVEYLDIDDNFGDNNLPLVLKREPDIENSLHKINNMYYYSAQVTAGMYMLNLIVSTISIYMHSAGSPTVTAYASFVILILMKLYNAVYISRDSRGNNMALSAYMTELQSFNVIDKDHRKRDAWVEENGERCRRDATAHSGMLEGVSLDEIELSDSSKKKMEKPIIADLNLL